MAGRPSKYRVELCELLVTHMSNGLSFESFSVIAGVHRDTLFEWSRKHLEFSDAKKKGEAGSLLFWEKLGIEGVKGTVKGFNAAMWIFNMKNRFKWRDRAEDLQAEKTEEYRPLKNIPTDDLVKFYERLMETKFPDSPP